MSKGSRRSGLQTLIDRFLGRGPARKRPRKTRWQRRKEIPKESDYEHEGHERCATAMRGVCYCRDCKRWYRPGMAYWKAVTGR